MPLAPGDILAGKFHVERILGEGGMGVVLCARDASLDRLCAIKVMHQELTAQPALVERFLREARAAAKLKSRHAARIYEVSTLEDGTPYIVMEYLQGRDLAQTLTERGALAPSTAVNHLLEACEAVAEAHGLGIVHRDLKPANLFLEEAEDGPPVLKVLDFGIAKVGAPRDDGSALTDPQSALGTPEYMSPEQLQDPGAVDQRADVWALGVVLYELVSGRRPFTGQNFTHVAVQVMTGSPPDLKALCDGLDSDLHAIIERCLQKGAADRFSDVQELAQALRRVSVSSQASVKQAGFAFGATHPATPIDPSVRAIAARSVKPAAGGTLPEGVPQKGSVEVPKLAVFALLGVAGLIAGFYVVRALTGNTDPASQPSAVDDTPRTAATSSGPIVTPIPAGTTDTTASAATPDAAPSVSAAPKPVTKKKILTTKPAKTAKPPPATQCWDSVALLKCRCGSSPTCKPQ